jgi:hypothetical protein
MSTLTPPPGQTPQRPPPAWQPQPDQPGQPAAVAGSRPRRPAQELVPAAHTYVDPRAGVLTVEQLYADWSQRQVWTNGTEKAMKLAVTSTTFYGVSLGLLRASSPAVAVGPG